jgi:hypothetical protein
LEKSQKNTNKPTKPVNHEDNFSAAWKKLQASINRRPKKTRGFKSPVMERQKHQFHPFPVSYDPKSVTAWRNKTKPMKNRTTNRSRLRPTWFLSTEPFAETLCRNNFD